MTTFKVVGFWDSNIKLTGFIRPTHLSVKSAHLYALKGASEKYEEPKLFIFNKQYLQDFLRSRGSGTGSNQTREDK
jgi:hypothetical protein